MRTPPPPRHKWITTDDGSLTLFSEVFQEGCHSTTGAESETLLHYVHGCEVPQKILLHEGFTILEVGFGLGVGLQSTIKALQDVERPWRFISLELDHALIDWYVEQNKISATWDGHILKAQLGQCELIIIQGDARQTLPPYLATQKGFIHSIYQDAFSPKRNPGLWTKEWFSLLKTYSHEDVILSTYSASNSIRKALLEAGWKLSRGEKFGPKRASTRAHLKGDTDSDLLLQLSRSPTPALSDDNIELFLRGWKT